MIDYDLPIVDKDKSELLGHKFLFEDKEQQENINYMELFKEVGPKRKPISLESLVSMSVKI